MCFGRFLKSLENLIVVATMGVTAWQVELWLEFLEQTLASF